MTVALTPHSSNTAMIAGASVGGTIGAMILLALLVCLIRRRAARSRQQMEGSQAETAGIGEHVVATEQTVGGKDASVAYDVKGAGDFASK